MSATTKDEQVLSIQIDDPSLFDQYNPGDRVYLISWFDDSRRNREYYKIQTEVPVTNMGGVERPEGWLGSTNNINETAHGLHEIENLLLVERLSKEVIAGRRRTESVATIFKLSKV
jgi:hypothetical protein